jgi:hypothetical protein
MSRKAECRQPLQTVSDIGAIYRPLAEICASAPHIKHMTNFDYAAPAELFACASRGASRRPIQYRRFSTGAEAIRYAIEVLPAEQLVGAILQVDEDRFDGRQIRQLYEHQEYPLRA